jgi:hypothetical protein
MAKRKYRGKTRGSGKRPDSALYKWMMARKGTGKKVVAAVSGGKKSGYKKSAGRRKSAKPASYQGRRFIERKGESYTARQMRMEEEFGK